MSTDNLESIKYELQSIRRVLEEIKRILEKDQNDRAYNSYDRQRDHQALANEIANALKRGY